MINEYRYLASFKPKGYPVKHRHREAFDPDLLAPSEFMARTRKIRELDHELDRFIFTAKDYFELVSDAYASNIHWSTSLEGNPLTDQEVVRVTRETLSGQVRERPPGPSQEVVNHLVNLLYPQLFSLPWTEQKVCELNRMLLADTGTTARTGEYRAHHVMVGDPGTGEEHFIAAPPDDVPDQMRKLIQWTNGRSQVYDPIIAATVMFHEFESIHPFENGNGRTGRCLFHLFLQATALKNSHLCKIDHKMIEDRDLYYDLLAYTDETGSYRELIDFFSLAILRSYEEANEALGKKDLLSMELDETSKRLAQKAKAHRAFFSIAEARGWAGNLSEQTIGKRLSELEDLGFLESSGRTKSRRYRMKDPLSEFRDGLKDGKGPAGTL